MRRVQSTLRLSNDLLSPSSKAIRAYGGDDARLNHPKTRLESNKCSPSSQRVLSPTRSSRAHICAIRIAGSEARWQETYPDHWGEGVRLRRRFEARTGSAGLAEDCGHRDAPVAVAGGCGAAVAGGAVEKGGAAAGIVGASDSAASARDRPSLRPAYSGQA
jgi:hypothetical protein